MHVFKRPVGVYSPGSTEACSSKPVVAVIEKQQIQHCSQSVPASTCFDCSKESIGVAEPFVCGYIVIAV